MKKNIKNMAITLLILVMYLMMITSPVLAVELPITKIKFSVSLEGTLPTKAEKFTVNLKANNINNPMPEGNVNETYSMTVEGEDIAYFPEITFSRVGVYNYTIWQEKGNNVDCTYDYSTYNLTVYVTNKENGEGLEATSVLYKNNETNKVDAANFNNVYKTITPIKEEVKGISDTVVNTGDTSNIIFWVILSTLGVIGILFIVLSAHKKNGNNN